MRAFLVAVIFSLVLFLAGEYVFLFNLRMMTLMLGLTFTFGLFTQDNVSLALGNLLGLLVGQALGSLLVVFSFHADFPITVLDEVVRGILNDGSFVYWFLGFPCGVWARRYLPETFIESASSDSVRDHFIHHKLGSRAYSFKLGMQEEEPFEAVTSPSIKLG